jgi:hypothetical protein
MRSERYINLTVFFLLAWVLWAEFPRGIEDGVVRLVPGDQLGKSDYKVIDGFATADECRAARLKIPKPRNAKSVLCLPSSVDPRQ